MISAFLKLILFSLYSIYETEYQIFFSKFRYNSLNFFFYIFVYIFRNVHFNDDILENGIFKKN